MLRTSGALPVYRNMTQPPASLLSLSLVLALSAVIGCGGPSSSGDTDAGTGIVDAGGPPPPSFGDRFETAAVEFGVPAGGIKISGIASLSRQSGYENVGDEYWVVRDLTGDGVPDLVITTVLRDIKSQISVDDIFDEVYGYPTASVWRVYPGNATGFATTFVAWTLPAGGRTARGFNRAQRSGGGARNRNDINDLNKLGDEAWTLQDMDGDRKPDLVVTGVATDQATVGPVFQVYGAPSSPHWKVYKNTGAGFSTTATTWAIPTAYQWDTFAGLSTESSAAFDQYHGALWTLRDMDGDRKPDLVAYAEVQKVTGATVTYRARTFGQPATPHWDVFLNKGSGFAPTATPFNLPRQRGLNDDGLNALAGAGTKDGENNWVTDDINGDGKPDIIVTGSQLGLKMKAPGYPSSSHWEVYLNNGASFEPITTWALPAGGSGSSGFLTVSSPGVNIAGDHAWATFDINGDGKLDLVVTGEFTAGGMAGVYGLGRLGNDPQWRVHLNTGAGFVIEGKQWKLPAGGNRTLGFNNTFGTGAKVGDESWALLDMNSDRQPELLITSNTIERPDSPGSGFTLSVVNGLGAKPHWRVYKNVP